METVPYIEPAPPTPMTPAAALPTDEALPPATPPVPARENDPLRTSDFQPTPELLAKLVGSPLPQVPGFVVEQELGRGGMGVVYRARQMPLNRVVALKMILAGDHAGADAKARFLAEAEAIAKVQHAGIVQVHEFGTHQGNPFFALEFIEGGSLDQRLRQGPLPAKEAAALGAQLAEAMQAAHAQGIIHRDLKPANVLLQMKNEECRLKNENQGIPPFGIRHSTFGIPKITDFGLAKQIDAGPGLTATGAIMGTPSYMAPEQAAGRGQDIGPATDVYALGAILYECLTGRPPFHGATVFDTIDQVLRQEPTPVRQLQPKVPQDVETICHKCLQKEAAKRYATAQALAEDLRNYLAGKPIVARPVGRLERTWKWCKRYPAIAALVVVSVVAAIVATGLAIWATQERNAKDQALTEKSTALAAETKALARAKERLTHVENGVQLLAGMMTGINPHFEEQGGPTVLQLLRDNAVRAADRLDAEAVGDPQTVARLQTILGNTLRELGEHPKAIALLEKARQTQEQELAADDHDRLTTLHNLALAYRATGQQPQATRLFEQVRAVQEATHGLDHPDTLTTLGNLALAYQDVGKLPDAIRLLEQVHAAQEARLGPEHHDLLILRNNLAFAYQEAGQMSQAIRLYEQVRVAQEKTLGPEHRSTLVTLMNLASVYSITGKLPDAIRLYEQVGTIRENKFGPDHPSTLTALGSLAQAYQAAGKLPDAIRLLERVRTAQEAKLGPEHPHTLTTLGILAGAYRASGKLPDAIRLYEQVRAIRESKFGPEHPDTLTTVANLANTYQVAGKLPEAIPLLERVYKAYDTKLGPEHPNTLITLTNLARAYQLARDLEKALPLYERAATGSAKRPALRALASRIIPYTINVYEEAQQWDQAERWQRQWLTVVKNKTGADSLAYAGELAGLGQNLLRQRKWADAEAFLRECLTIREKKEPEAWTTFDIQSKLGAALLGQKKYSEAEPLLLQGYQGLKQREAKIPKQGKVNFIEALEQLVALHEAQGKKEEAAKWQRELQTLKGPTDDARNK